MLREKLARIPFLSPHRILLWSVLWVGFTSVAIARETSCPLTTINVAPLNDLGPGEYKPGVFGGLYPDGMNNRPQAHESAGRDIAMNFILPRNAMGQVDPAGGRIGLISIGMSNTQLEFDGQEYTFKPRAEADPAANSALVLVNGAQGGQTAKWWSRPHAPAWEVLEERILEAGLTSAQVQVAWIKQAERNPAELGEFPAHAQVLLQHLEAIVQIARAKYPNLRIVYLSSRTRSYTDDPATINPEPYAFESGFAVRWLIERQLSGDSGLNFDPVAGVAPWLSWGPYLWADGEAGRSDGFVWSCTDVAADFTHPSASGRAKVADQLLAFFKTDPTAAPWFLRGDAVGAPPEVEASADVSEGHVPLTVQFSAIADDPDGSVTEFAWTFDDGGFSFEQNPGKIFPAPGFYEVRLTVSDNDGNTALATIPIAANESGDPSPPQIVEPTALADVVVGVPFSATFKAVGSSPISWNVVAGELPPGMALTPEGVYEGIPDLVGDYVFSVEAVNFVGSDFRDYIHSILESDSDGVIHLFSPVGDAHVTDGIRADSNFGSLDTLLARTTNAVGRNARSFLKFDLSSLDCTLTAAQLQMFLNSISLSNSPPIWAYSVQEDSWDEATITWNNQPPAEAPMDSVQMAAAGSTYSFNVTTFVLQQLGNDGIAGFSLRFDAVSNALASFDSREGANPPMLEVACEP